MNELENAEPMGLVAVNDLAKALHDAPGLADLSPTQLEAIARVAYTQRLADELNHKADIAGIDYQAEREAFLVQAGRTKSPNTLKAYTYALDRLEAYAKRLGIQVLVLKPRHADDWAQSLAAEGRASASVRRDIAAASSFFTFLERRHEVIRNPFRGSKARPAKRASKKIAIPSADEIPTILDALEPIDRAAATVLFSRGLRVGALPGLSIRGNRFTSRSKGKDITGDLPPEALAAIRGAGLDCRLPFSQRSETKIADAIRKRTATLAKAGTIKAAYSAHDLRHYYAVTEYAKDHDIYRVSKLLGHASIQVTETYLRSLGEVD